MEKVNEFGVALETLDGSHKEIPDKKREKLTLAEQFQLYCQLRREGKLPPDTDDDGISLGMKNIDWGKLRK